LDLVFHFRCPQPGAKFRFNLLFLELGTLSFRARCLHRMLGQKDRNDQSDSKEKTQA
jgi:hypothetical protein